MLGEGRIVLVRGRVDVRNDRASIVADSITNELPVRADSVQARPDKLQEPEPDYNTPPPISADFDPEDENAPGVFVNGEIKKEEWTGSGTLSQVTSRDHRQRRV